MASALFAKAAHDHGVASAVSASGGFLEGGRPVHEFVTELLDERDIDVSRKRSQKLTGDLVDKADLILTMTTEHARRLVSQFPDAIAKVYTQRHFGRLVQPRPSDVSIHEWLDELHQQNPRSYVSDDEVLDTPDPIGQQRKVFVELSVELENSIDWIMGCAYPSASEQNA